MFHAETSFNLPKGHIAEGTMLAEGTILVKGQGQI